MPIFATHCLHLIQADADAEYGSKITTPDASNRDGYDFAWADVPETMPAKDITIYGSYTTGIDSIDIDSSNARIYDLQGNRLDKPQKGVNIARMNDGSIKKVLTK